MAGQALPFAAVRTANRADRAPLRDAGGEALHHAVAKRIERRRAPSADRPRRPPARPHCTDCCTAGDRLRERTYSDAFGPTGRQRQQRAQCVGRIRLVQRRELREPFRCAPPASRREWIDHDATADGSRRRRVAQHQPVARQRTDGAIERQPCQHRAAWFDPFGVQRRDTRGHMRGAEMQMHRRIGAQRADSSASNVSRTSKRAVGACTAGCSTQSPRVTASFDKRGPVTFSAAR